MQYQTVLATMQKTDSALRACLGGVKFKKLKAVETRTLETQKNLMNLVLFARNNPEITTIQEFKNLAPEDQTSSEYFKALADDKIIANIITTLQSKCRKLFAELRSILSTKAGATELYSRAVAAKADFTRLHSGVGAPTLSEITQEKEEAFVQRRETIKKIDELMAGSIYRNQADITYVGYIATAQELFGLDLILKNYTDESSRNLPEVEVLRSSSVWKYIGVGEEPVRVRMEELYEKNERFETVGGVMELIHSLREVPQIVDGEEPEDDIDI